MKKVLIIGGSGFFGKTFLKLFLKNKLKKWKISSVYILSRNPLVLNKVFGQELKNVFLIKGNIANIKDLPVTDYIIYAATSTDQKVFRNFKKFASSNIFGILNFLKIIKLKKHKKTNILYMSSGAVYGPNLTLKKISENNRILKLKESKVTSKNVYTFIKVSTENLINQYNKNRKNKIFIARCFAFVGEFLPLDTHYFIGNLINSVITKKEMVVKSNNLKKVFRSYMYADDFVKCILKILKTNNKFNTIYNVGSDKPVKLFNLINFFLRFYKIKLNNKLSNSCLETQETDFYVPNIDLLRKKIKFKLTSSLKNSIINSINNLKNKHYA